LARVDAATAVVLCTRFPLVRDRAGAEASGAPSPDLHFEAFNALAEALARPSMVLRQRQPDGVYMTRIAELNRRSTLLQHAVESADNWHNASARPRQTHGSAP
jgi:hypothetical protein